MSHKKDGLLPSTSQAVLVSDGQMRYSGVWGEGILNWNVIWDQTETTLETNIASELNPELSDIAICAPGSPVPSLERARKALEVAERNLKEEANDLINRLAHVQFFYDARFARAQAFYNVCEWQKALDDLNALVERAPREFILYRHRSLTHAHLKHKDEALADVAKYREGDGTEGDKLAVSVVVTAELGEGETQAIEALEAAIKKLPEDKGLLYDASCAYSLASVPVSARDKSRGRGYADKAVAFLAQAIRQGYSDFAHILEDIDLDPIRDHPGYAEAVKPGHLDRRYTAVWSSVLGREAVSVFGLDPSAQRERCLELEAKGYRPVSISAARTTPEGSLVTVSVWHRPVISEETKDRLAERQARAAVSLVRLGKAEEVWPLLQHSADPRLRSFIVNWVNPLGTDPKIISAVLDHIDPGIKPPPAKPPKAMDAILFHPETSMRRALILALGTYGSEGLSSGERELLTAKLLDLYRTDPDSGIHGAAAWTLRQWKQQESLKAVDTELAKLKDGGDRRWFVNGQGQTYVVIEGPVEFGMGSPFGVPERRSDDTLRRIVIPRRFAIASREVTVFQYQWFMKKNTWVDQAYNDENSLDPNGPMNGVNWYDAAAYCNWLSEQEGLPKNQWCYLPNQGGTYDEGMTIPADVLNRTGYRLPTEAEWEYACRSGTITSRYYGLSTDLLGKHAWYGANSQYQAWSGGSLIPNELGLFDMLGNVYEWVQDRIGRPSKFNVYINITNCKITNNMFVLRGGSFSDQAENVRSVSHALSHPSDRKTNYGFRPSRTYP